MEEEIKILSKIDKKTDEILKSVKSEVAGAVTNLKQKSNELQNEEDKRKEQLKKAQKNFKKIGFNCKISTYEKFEELAKTLNVTTTMLTRQFMMLLLENKEFQQTFKEFQKEIIV